MKKLLGIIVLGLLLSGNAYADDSYEAAFKKALDNHQYYFKHKGKSYTTDTKDKPFDFFDHGYKDYRSAAKYMFENYPDDKSSRCFMFKGKQWGFDGRKINDTDTFYTYSDYSKDGWQNKIITTSNDKLIKVIFHEDNGCRNQDTYFQVLFEDKIFYDSRKDFEELTSDGWSIFLNINHYIDKDLNNNGKQELFIDVGISIGNNWIESYYFFEYDESSIKLIKNFMAGDWKERLGVSHLLKAKLEATEEVFLAKIINRNFSENVYVECIEGDCINGNGTFDSRFGVKYVGEFKDGKYHGQGTKTDVNGDEYVGEFKNGLKNGQGTLIFRHGEPNDQGTYIYTDGNKYVGEFKDGDMKGQGTLIYADGNKFVGEFEYGEPNGQGTLIYADGEKFVGEFEFGKPIK
jgi:hypothetical protein